MTNIPVCQTCHGAGQLDSGKNSPSTITCPRCGGTGYPPEQNGGRSD